KDAEFNYYDSSMDEYSESESDANNNKKNDDEEEKEKRNDISKGTEEAGREQKKDEEDEQDDLNNKHEFEKLTGDDREKEKQDDIGKGTEEAGSETKNDGEEVHAKVDDPNEQMKDKEADKKSWNIKRKSPEDMTPQTFSLGLTPKESKPTEKEKEKQVEKKAKGLSQLESKPKPNEKEEKAVKREKRPSRFLVSPYLNKKTFIKRKAKTDEVMVTQYLFSMEGEELDFVFETKDGAATIRDYMQTLASQLKVKYNVIDTLSLILNHGHKMNSKGKRTKYFFHTTMIVST
ncbi:hypothetical protein Tco_1276675, partial [Tanacetum coccineum]